ncbi:unnamed protein product [Cyclocybe aegerita]|uniref:Uncharacterized protein n=1 Tax=Cyclocybe aegerita TaxID=1973307 RepID=A0A8S0XIC2_CYCAE|nr:unnamed protein product [Cyclocybe aegerita]
MSAMEVSPSDLQTVNAHTSFNAADASALGSPRDDDRTERSLSDDSFVSVTLPDDVVLESGTTVPPLEFQADVELLSLVPVIERLIHSSTLEGGEYRIMGDITESEWTSLKSYARRVRELKLGPDDGSTSPKIADMTFFRLALQQRPGKALFPSLKQLSILGATSSLFYLHLFLSPSLTSVEFTDITEISQPAIASFLMMLGSRAPSLHRLELSSLRLSPTIIASLQQCKSLRHFVLNDLKIAPELNLLDVLKSLPLLTVLTTNVHSENVSDARPGGFHDQTSYLNPTSHSLKTLHLSGPSPSINEIVQGAVTACDTVKDLQIIMMVKGPTRRVGSKSRQVMLEAQALNEAFDFLLTLPLGRWAQSLTSLAIGVEDTPTFPERLFEALEDLQLLKYLQLWGATIKDLDGSLRQLSGSSWRKNIESLHFPFAWCEKGSSAIAVDTLVHFAAICPKLESLHVLVDIQSSSDRRFILPDGQNANNISPSHLRKLSIGSSSFPSMDVANIAALAFTLSAHFPHLETIETDESYSGARWKDVDSLLRMSRASAKFALERLTVVIGDGLSA